MIPKNFQELELGNCHSESLVNQSYESSEKMMFTKTPKIGGSITQPPIGVETSNFQKGVKKSIHCNIFDCQYYFIIILIFINQFPLLLIHTEMHITSFLPSVVSRIFGSTAEIIESSLAEFRGFCHVCSIRIHKLQKQLETSIFFETFPFLQILNPSRCGTADIQEKKYSI
ncbi:hypothetical protein Avbf_17836 [Armadillidium vulgare]|nr:hypothetical protein Avbf_17836 [Armadillidium vulgare]